MQRNHRKTRRHKKKNSRYILMAISIICITVAASFIIGSQKVKGPHPLSIGSGSGYADTENDSAETSGGSVNEEDWCMVLVNKWNPVTPDNKNEITTLSNGERVDKRIYPQLQKMFEAARDDGKYPIVASGYRTAQEQEEIFSERIAGYKAEGLSDAEAKKETEKWVAVPGTSEHQLGLAVDINADGINSKGSEVYDWLKDNAHLYGFINRYPADKTDITGVSNEPWHYRYVGVKAATEIYKQGVCLEEYLGKVN